MFSDIIMRVTLNRNCHLTVAGERTVVISIYKPGTKERAIINTKIRVYEKDFKHGRVQDSDPLFCEKNKKIIERYKRLMQFECEQEQNGNEISPKRLKEYYLNNLSSSATIDEWVDSVIMPSTRKVNTKYSYKSLSKSINEYRKETRLGDLNYDFLERYTQWMRNVKMLKENTIIGKMKALRCLVNEAIKRDVIKIDKDPFKNYTIGEMTPNDIYLEPAEVRKLEKMLFEDKSLEHVRDAFLFCCFTGLRFSDFKNLTEFNYNKKHHKLSIKQSKTGNMVELPLNKLFGGRPLEIMMKYKSIEDFVSIGHNTSVNKKLKTIEEMSKMKKHLHFHLARHTCGTLLNMKGLLMQEIQKILGHARMETTSKIYAVTSYKQISKSLSAAFKHKKKKNNETIENDWYDEDMQPDDDWIAQQEKDMSAMNVINAIDSDEDFDILMDEEDLEDSE